jgi:DNA-binding IscR family transcriptional regulator
VQQLVRLGFVVSRPGRNGGVGSGATPMRSTAARSSPALRGARLLPCVKDQTYCVLEPGCALRSALIQG